MSRQDTCCLVCMGWAVWASEKPRSIDSACSRIDIASFVTAEICHVSAFIRSREDLCLEGRRDESLGNACSKEHPERIVGPV